MAETPPFSLFSLSSLLISTFFQWSRSLASNFIPLSFRTLRAFKVSQTLEAFLQAKPDGFETLQSF